MRLGKFDMKKLLWNLSNYGLPNSVNIFWIGLLTCSHSLNICTDEYFGQKVVDTETPQSYYLCLGFLGKIHNNCDEGYRFNGTQQKCILGENPKTLAGVPFNASDSSVGPKNEININQNILMYKPIIFNIFGITRATTTTTIVPPITTTGNNLLFLSNTFRHDSLCTQSQQLLIAVRRVLLPL